ncbi:MAG: FtsX-like permease family protein [Verrucomicrobiota bacterium]
MNMIRLILRELCFRKLNFFLGVLGIAAAVGCLVAELTLLRKHDLTTEKILAAKQVETEAMLDKLEDDYRKITLKLGFNILILPKEQSLQDLYDEDKTSQLLPEAYADKLAKSRVATINHVLPTLTRKVKWPERQRKVVLMGVKGEVFIQSAKQKPLLEAVPPGHLVAGYELHQSLGLAVGQTITFMGRPFTVSKLLEEKGNADDITLWINLNEAQELLQCPGRINAILALECNCSADRLAKIRAEITNLLPDTKVVEFASQALARAEARNRAGEQAALTLQHEQANRAALRAQRESFAAILVPTALVAAGLWIALLTIANVRDRRPEIGVLRAIGVQSWQILGIFIGKAVLSGLVGAVAGAGLGLVAGAYWQERPTPELWSALMTPQLFLAALVVAPLLAVMASWLPALLAARQDPAVVLQDR